MSPDFPISRYCIKEHSGTSVGISVNVRHVIVRLSSLNRTILELYVIGLDVPLNYKQIDFSTVMSVNIFAISIEFKNILIKHSELTSKTLVKYHCC